MASLHDSGMATSVRLPDVLKAEAARYAAELGISINALVAVALREYLDHRPPGRGASESSPSGIPESPVGVAAPTTMPAPPGGGPALPE